MSLENVKKYLQKYGKEQEVIILDSSIATVELAARALNVSEAEIAKSLAMKIGDECIVIVAAGDTKIDNAKYKSEFGCKARMLEHEETFKKTSHQVGGVCPFALPDDVKVYLDQSLKRFITVYPACGSIDSAIALTLNELFTISKAIKWVDVTKQKVEEEVVFVNRCGTNSIKWDAQPSIFNSSDLTPFWVADSDFKTPSQVIDALVSRSKHGAFGYTYASDDYFNAIINWFKKRCGYVVERDWIIPMSGVVASLATLIAHLVLKRANIVIQTPVYNPFYEVIAKNDCVIQSNALINNDEDYTIDFDNLAKLLEKSQMMILCNPHNPVGRVWTYQEIEKIVNLCKDNDCILISDEIHCDLIMPEYQFTSAAKFYDSYDKIIILTAPSKTFNIAGLSSSNIFIKDAKLREKYVQGLENSFFTTTNIYGLAACEAAYRYGEVWLEKQIELLNNNKKTVVEFINTYLPRAKVSPLQGTYLMWINLQYLNLSSDKLLEMLIANKISVNKGSTYGKDYDGYIRLNIACSKEQLNIALMAIKNAFYNI